MQLTEKVSSISETCFFLNRKNKNYCYLHEIYTSAKSEEASDKKNNGWRKVYSCFK